MLSIKIFSFSDLIFAGKFEKVNFYSYKEGLIGIHTNHETMKFKITPSKIVLTNGLEEMIFYSGCGFASICKNSLLIIGYPITSNFEKFEETCDRLNGYGSLCKEAFDKFLS